MRTHQNLLRTPQISLRKLPFMLTPKLPPLYKFLLLLLRIRRIPLRFLLSRAENLLLLTPFKLRAIVLGKILLQRLEIQLGFRLLVIFLLLKSVGGLWTLFSISEFFLCVLLFEKFHFDLEVSKFDFHFCVCLGFCVFFEFLKVFHYCD